MKTFLCFVWAFGCLCSQLVLAGCAGYSPGPLSITPDDAALPFAQAAADRLFAASGIRVPVDPHGVPVTFVAAPLLLDLGPNGERLDPPEPVCGYTNLSRLEEEAWAWHITVSSVVSDACPTVAGSMLHEMIHAILPEVVNEHAASGAFARYAGPSMLLNDDTLTFICEHLACSRYQPEGE